ncbi:hypothetical protein GmHk_07G018272 [Glycine max]|uniref:Uncharacterized protein n=2 Tax=Glycine soja TaxID=3848 RepID=A0A445JRC2_GLYSO|nr:hypothetical protein GmHk_07G018272 [Glycine max]RZC01049.1 hypothetical protein D0Y65_016700 [Glycine soja]
MEKVKNWDVRQGSNPHPSRFICLSTTKTPSSSFHSSQHLHHRTTFSSSLPRSTNSSAIIMSKVNDQWVTMVMADDTLVANQLLLLRRHHHHHRPSVIRRWVHRQRRTPRLPISGARDTPTTPLTWTTATSIDGYEGHTRKTATTHPSAASKAVDESESAADKRMARKKRILRDLQREHTLKLHENEDLRNKLAAVNLTIDKKRATAKNIKKIKLGIKSRGTLEIAQAILNPPKSVEAQCDTPNLGSEKTVEDQILEPVCSAANVPSNKREIGAGKRPLLLPDLNQPPEEYLNTEFLGFSQ